MKVAEYRGQIIEERVYMFSYISTPQSKMNMYVCMYYGANIYHSTILMVPNFYVYHLKIFSLVWMGDSRSFVTW